PHHGLPAFPALALLVARVWDETIDAAPGSAGPRALLGPLLVLFALATIALVAAWSGVVRIPPDVLATLDGSARRLAATGRSAPGSPLDAWRPLLARGAVIFGIGTVAMAVALWRRAVALGVGVALATTIAFLPTVAAEGMAQFARARSVQPLAATLAQRLRPGDVVLHEGAIEHSASALLVLPVRVGIVNGFQSSLAFGATFPEAREVFWDGARPAAPGRGRGGRAAEPEAHRGRLARDRHRGGPGARPGRGSALRADDRREPRPRDPPARGAVRRDRVRGRARAPDRPAARDLRPRPALGTRRLRDRLGAEHRPPLHPAPAAVRPLRLHRPRHSRPDASEVLHRALAPRLHRRRRARGRALHRDAGAALSSVADELAQALGRRDAHDQRGDRAEPPATARVPIHRARPTQGWRGDGEP